MKKYRIIKKHRRNKDTAKIECWYIIEYLNKKYFWSKKKTWIEYTVMRCYGLDDVNEVVIFNNLTSAREYLENLNKPIPKDKIIKT